MGRGKEMKKLLLFIFFILAAYNIFPQGTTNTPYDTTNWDLPYGYTPHYGLYIFRLLSNPGGRINTNTKDIDSLLYSLIVYTDTNQMVIRNDTLVMASYMSGTHSFVGTVGSDSVAVPNMDSLDIIIVTALASAYNVNDILFVQEHTGYFKVYRNSTGGTSGLSYNWIWKRNYQ